MAKIVIDACVAIDLSIPKVNFLEEFLSYINDDQILISSVNHEEILNVARKKPYSLSDSYKIQQLLKNSNNVKIIKNDETSFDEFYSELKSLGFGIGRNDAHVLFLANESNADFIVSSDFNVYDKAKQFKQFKQLDCMNPMTTITLLAYIYEQDKIGYSVFLEKTLRLYKYKEIDNMLKHLNENLCVSKPSDKIIIDEFKQSMKERFQDYKEPLITEYKHLMALTALGRLPT